MQVIFSKHHQYFQILIASVLVVLAGANWSGHGHGVEFRHGHLAVPAPAYHAPAHAYHAPASYKAPAKKETPKPFAFSYAVADDYSGSNFNAQENQSADGAVSGSYSVNLPDGRIQTVTYTADHYNGYLAEVSYSGEASYPPLKAYKAPAYKAPSYAPRTYVAPKPTYNA